MQRDSFLSDDCPPMGIYETLYAFLESFGQFMGTEGTHPWSQGFPLTTPLTDFDGPELPSSVNVTWEDRFYPKAWGHPLLRETIVDYYNTYYGSSITPDNVMIFAGGRPGIWTVLSFRPASVAAARILPTASSIIAIIPQVSARASCASRAETATE